MKVASGKVSRSSLCSMSSRPRRQVQIRKKIAAATISGTYPPSNTFIRLAETNERSTTINNPATSRLAGRLQPQISRITKNISTDVSSMVSETATPNAAARLSEERKASVSPSVNVISTQLTEPT